MKVKYVWLFILILGLAYWCEAIYQDAKLYPVNSHPINQERVLTFEESPRRVLTQDSVLVIFSALKVLELLKEYQSYCETTEGVTVIYRWVGMKLISDTLSTSQKQMTLEGLIDWLENVKLKEQQ